MLETHPVHSDLKASANRSVHFLCTAGCLDQRVCQFSSLEAAGGLSTALTCTLLIGTCPSLSSRVGRILPPPQRVIFFARKRGFIQVKLIHLDLHNTT